jgi:hypothetical protein
MISHNCPTIPAPTPEVRAVPDHRTFPPMSMVTSLEGMAWAESIFARARTCSKDAARFMAGVAL